MTDYLQICFKHFFFCNFLDKIIGENDLIIFTTIYGGGGGVYHHKC